MQAPFRRTYILEEDKLQEYVTIRSFVSAIETTIVKIIVHKTALFMHFIPSCICLGTSCPGKVPAKEIKGTKVKEAAYCDTTLSGKPSSAMHYLRWPDLGRLCLDNFKNNTHLSSAELVLA